MNDIYLTAPVQQNKELNAISSGAEGPVRGGHMTALQRYSSTVRTTMDLTMDRANEGREAKRMRIEREAVEFDRWANADVPSMTWTKGEARWTYWPLVQSRVVYRIPDAASLRSSIGIDGFFFNPHPF